MPFPSFTASVVSGSKRGRTLGTPTLNLSLKDVPSELKQGIYACLVTFDHLERLPAVMHYGPRPAFDDAFSCELHVLDRFIPSPPALLHVTVISRIRDVKDYASREALVDQIHDDIAVARTLLSEMCRTFHNSH